MMMKVFCSLFLPLLLFNAVEKASSVEAKYNVISRRPSDAHSTTSFSSNKDDGRNHRRVLDGTESPPLLTSFDGDLDAIEALALAAAARNSGNSKKFVCNQEDAEPTQHLEVITYKYKMETAAQAVVEVTYGEVQEKTIDTIAERVLACKNETVAYAGIVAMDTAIASSVSDTDTCEADSNVADSRVCTVVIGRMRLFLSDKDAVQNATNLVLENIERAFEEPDFVDKVESGLLKITFMYGETFSGPNGINNPVTKDGDKTDGDVTTGFGATDDQDVNMTLTNLLFVAVGSAALVVFVGSVYLWRRSQRGDEEGAATQMAGSSLQISNDDIPKDAATATPNASARQSLSPYAEMVAGSYQYGENMSILSNNANMSPVEEVSEGASSCATPSLAKSSESGYNTDGGQIGEATMMSPGDASSMYASSEATTTPKILGARALPGAVVGDMDSDTTGSVAVSESDTDSDMSPIKMFSAAGISAHQETLLVPSGSAGNDEEEDEDAADNDLLFSPVKTPASDIRTVGSEEKEHAFDDVDLVATP